MKRSSRKREICRAYQGDERLRRVQLLLHELLSEQNRDLREAHMKSLYEMEELKRIQESRVDESSRRRLIENQDTINELTARIQELQNEVVDYPTFPVNLRFSHLLDILTEC